MIYELFKVAPTGRTLELMHVEFDDQGDTWHRFVNFERGSTFACPACGSESKAYDYVEQI